MRKRKILGEFQHLWRLTNTWVQKSKRRGKIIFALKEKKKNQNPRDAMKAALRGKL